MDFSLKHDEYQMILELPIGAEITIAEDEASASGYQITKINGEESSSRSTTFTLGEGSNGITTVTFLNIKEEQIDTGVDVDRIPYMLLIMAVLVLGTCSAVGHHIRKKRYE